MLTQLPPGALIATFTPRSEKPTLVPTWRSPPTAITPAQFAGVVSACPAVLPAATTITTPAAVISRTASAYALLHDPVPPRLMLITRAGFGFGGTPGTERPAAQRMPAMMSESRPPHLP